MGRCRAVEKGADRQRNDGVLKVVHRLGSIRHGFPSYQPIKRIRRASANWGWLCVYRVNSPIEKIKLLHCGGD